MSETLPLKTVLVTGAAGFIGTKVVAALAADRRDIEAIIAADVREVPAARRLPGVEYVTADVRAKDLRELIVARRCDAVVHLASIVTPPRGMPESVAYEVDVLGTRNVLEACLAAGTRSLIVTSSGAAYGFHRDNPEWLREDDALRGNDAFAYARHKRMVEEMLADHRERFPELRQLVLRPAVVLGEATDNQITDLFEKPVVLGIRGAATPMSMIWVDDVAAVIVRGLHERRAGIYNLAGDGAVTLADVATRLRKRLVKLPGGLVAGALSLLRKAGLTQYGPEQVMFLRDRSALSNERLKQDFPGLPSLTSRGVFERYLEARLARKAGPGAGPAARADATPALAAAK